MTDYFPEDPDTYHAIALIEDLMWEMDWNDKGALGKMARALEYLASSGSMNLIECTGHVH
jgi:hypothetical protein